jgi:hypothetical protein
MTYLLKFRQKWLSAGEIPPPGSVNNPGDRSMPSVRVCHFNPDIIKTLKILHQFLRIVL